MRASHSCNPIVKEVNLLRATGRSSRTAARETIGIETRASVRISRGASIFSQSDLGHWIQASSEFLRVFNQGVSQWTEPLNCIYAQGFLRRPLVVFTYLYADWEAIHIPGELHWLSLAPRGPWQDTLKHTWKPYQYPVCPCNITSPCFAQSK